MSRPRTLELVLLFCLGLLPRVAAIWYLGAAESGPITAHHEHRFIASSLARGDGFCFPFFADLDAATPTSQQAPLVPFTLAGCYLIFGHETPAAFGAFLFLQAACGGMMVVGVRLLLSAVGCTVAVARVAAGCAAVYPPLVIAAAHVQALPWNLLWLTAMMLGAAWVARGRSVGGNTALSVGAAGGLLTDPILGAVYAALLAVVAGRVATSLPAPQRGRTARPLAIGLGCVMLALAPWTYRNYQAHGRLVLVKSSFWYVFWQGNSAHSHGTDKLPVAVADAHRVTEAWHPRSAQAAADAARAEAVSVDSTLTPTQLAAVMAPATEIERMDVFGRLIRRQLVADPLSYPRHCLRRLGRWLWFDTTNPRSYLLPYRVCYLSLVTLALPGLWLGRCGWRAMWPLWAAALVLTAVHVGIITSARFRIPLELLLVPAAATTLVATAEAGLARRGRHRSRGVLPLGPSPDQSSARSAA